MRCTLISRWITLASLTLILGCSQRNTSADVKGDVEQALNQAGLKSVNVSQDRDKGIITLKGDVLTEAEKQKAEEIAKSMARSSVVANEIGVRPSGFESEAKKVDSSLDSAIEKNFEALVVGRQLGGAQLQVLGALDDRLVDLRAVGRRDPQGGPHTGHPGVGLGVEVQCAAVVPDVPEHLGRVGLQGTQMRPGAVQLGLGGPPQALRLFGGRGDSVVGHRRDQVPA